MSLPRGPPAPAAAADSGHIPCAQICAAMCCSGPTKEQWQRKFTTQTSEDKHSQTDYLSDTDIHWHNEKLLLNIKTASQQKQLYLNTMPRNKPNRVVSVKFHLNVTLLKRRFTPYLESLEAVGQVFLHIRVCPWQKLEGQVGEVLEGVGLDDIEGASHSAQWSTAALEVQHKPSGMERKNRIRCWGNHVICSYIIGLNYGG